MYIALQYIDIRTPSIICTLDMEGGGGWDRGSVIGESHLGFPQLGTLCGVVPASPLDRFSPTPLPSLTLLYVNCTIQV
jgi:hypothetical protein